MVDDASRVDPQSFAIREMRQIVGDLFRPTPAIYWTDFFVSMTIGYGAAAVYLRSPLFSLQQFLFLAIATVFIYRISLFMHEICHFRKGQMTAFKVVWNLFAGIPMLTPSFFYETHRDHHNTRHYGTEHDGEYLPLVSSGWRGVATFLLQPFLLPLLTVIRFVVVTPISFLHPRWRQWALEHWSSFVIDLKYKRPLDGKEPRRLWAWIEIACHLRAVALFAVCFLPFVPWFQFLLLYALAICILTLNHVRTLTAHRYRGTGETMSHAEQLFDSNDISSRAPWTIALCPVGLRFHALHHLFPGMPYHNLERAHLRLMSKLPEDAAYRRCVHPSFFSVIRQLARDIQDDFAARNAIAQRVTERSDRIRNDRERSHRWDSDSSSFAGMLTTDERTSKSDRRRAESDSSRHSVH